MLLNKVDLVPEGPELKKIETRIRSLSWTVKICMRTTQSKVDWKVLLGVGAFDVKRVLDSDPEFLTEPSKHDGHDGYAL